MIRIIDDKTYHFTSVFNDKTGEYIRGINKTDDPFMAEYPHLIDVGLMGHCEHGRSGLCMKAGIKCYQDGLHVNKPNMTFENYKKIVDWSEGRLFEIALGGAGDPDMHENFEKVLKYTREHGIIPNFTTSGLGMTPEKAAICKTYCGAVAVSMYSRILDVPFIAMRERTQDEERIPYKNINDIPIIFNLANTNKNCYVDEPNYVINNKVFKWEYLHHISEEDLNGKYELYRVYEEKQKPNYTIDAIQMLLKAGVKTNIHYVISNTTIDEAILRLKYCGFPEGINAVVFLLHKPVGLGTKDDVLNINDPRVKEFFELVDTGNLPFKVGFDSCSIPGVLKWSKNIDTCSIDTCEGSRFSMYITSDMKALPCSFDNQEQKYAVQLNDKTTIQDVWNSNEFESFRNYLRNSCPTCKNRALCMGGCPLQNSIVLCNNKERNFKDN